MKQAYTREHKRILLSAIVLLLSLILAACGGEAAETPTATPAPAETAGDETTATESDSTADASAQTYTVVTAESSASYIVNEEFFAEALEKLGIQAGEQIIVGTTSGVSGQMQLNFDNADPLVGAQFTVDMAGLETDQDRRDNWLSDNAIQTNRYPEATFVATSTTGLSQDPPEGEEVNFQLNGDLTVRETTIPATFDVTATKTGDTISGTAVLNLNLTDLGITPPDFANTLTVADPFRIEVDLTARQS